jgi:hypothetical protein
VTVSIEALESSERTIGDGSRGGHLGSSTVEDEGIGDGLGAWIRVFLKTKLPRPVACVDLSQENMR